MPMTLPDLEDVCGGCRHPFGLHWITHNGTFQGCLTMPQTAETLVKGGKVTEHAGKCDCHGFSVVWTPEVTLSFDPGVQADLTEALRVAATLAPARRDPPPAAVEWERQ